MGDLYQLSNLPLELTEGVFRLQTVEIDLFIEDSVVGVEGTSDFKAHLLGLELLR